MKKKLSKKKTGKKIAAKKNTEVALASSYEEDAGAGFEEADSQAFAIPFIAILQSNSPQCKKADGAYIKGAEEGMLWNPAKEEMFEGEEEGITVIPCHYRRVFIEWKPRVEGGGGGFVAEHSVEEGVKLLRTCTRNDKSKEVLPNGNHLVDTRVHYCMAINANRELEPVVISMASTQIKASKKWMSKMDALKMKRIDGSMFTPPMFSHIYQLYTIPQSNEKGSWYGWTIVLLGQVDEADFYQKAKAFRGSVNSGEAKATYDDTVVAEAERVEDEDKKEEWEG